ncbi:hypothetical protein KFU94_00750 [Chloroflexi bacterium TSY]|nr:hypothetical protein [Chloroflexi bacterium TSY]
MSRQSVKRLTRQAKAKAEAEGGKADGNLPVILGVGGVCCLREMAGLIGLWW